MKTLIITGNIGSGKSAACDILARKKHLPIYDSDSRTKALYDEVPGLIEDLEERLNSKLRGEDGKLDRKALANIIFSNEEALSIVESIMHPLVLKDFEAWKMDIEKQVEEGAIRPITWLVFESAIILQKPMFAEFGDCVIEIFAPEELRIKRACARDGVSEDVVRARIEAQNNELRVREPDFIIENMDDFESLKFDLLSLYLYLNNKENKE